MSFQFNADMHAAPRDGRPLLLLTSDFGAVEGRWDADEPDFHDGTPGAWVSDNWRTVGDPDEKRLFCGAMPVGWAEMPKTRHLTHTGVFAYG